MQVSAPSICSLPATVDITANPANKNPAASHTWNICSISTVLHNIWQPIYYTNSSHFFWKSLGALHQSLVKHGIYTISNSRTRSQRLPGITELMPPVRLFRSSVKAGGSPCTPVTHEESLPGLPALFDIPHSIFSLNLSMISIDLFVLVLTLLFSSRSFSLSLK